MESIDFSIQSNFCQYKAFRLFSSLMPFCIVLHCTFIAIARQKGQMVSVINLSKLVMSAECHQCLSLLHVFGALISLFA